MNDLPYLQQIFQKLRGGYHISGGYHVSNEDNQLFSALLSNDQAYSEYFSPLGLKLVRHPRDFFYFEPENTDVMRDSLAKIAVFSFILVDDVANRGKPVEEFILNTHFLASTLPHFSLDRYTALLRNVGVEDHAQLVNVLKSMKNLGWLTFLTDDEFLFLRPFHRVFDKCLELSKAGQAIQSNQSNPSES